MGTLVFFRYQGGGPKRMDDLCYQGAVLKRMDEIYHQGAVPKRMVKF